MKVNLWTEGGDWFAAVFIDGQWDSNADAPDSVKTEDAAEVWAAEQWPNAEICVI